VRNSKQPDVILSPTEQQVLAEALRDAWLAVNSPSKAARTKARESLIPAINMMALGDIAAHQGAKP
jgi:hypothetical protein